MTDKRIDVGKLRGSYYNNERENYVSEVSYADVQKSLATDYDSLQDNMDGIDFDDIENRIVKYIQTMPICNYNDILNSDTGVLDDIEIHTNLIKVYAEFHTMTSFSTVFLIYCDYFNLKYNKVIKDLPNGAKIQLYGELRNFTRNTENLDTLFGFTIDEKANKLF